MKTITKRKLIALVADRWHEQYFRDGKWYDERKAQIHRALAGLPPDATKQQVADIIGNGSWTSLACDECGAESEAVVEVGQEPDYESSTARLCPSCVRRAAVALWVA